MAWRAAASLLTLQRQVNAAWPGRNKASDGIIGDLAHQGTVSDHNPDRNGVVRAIDITHDPVHGCDIDRLSDALAESRDARISYLIANGMITGPNYGWEWVAYDGDDPHTNHLHLSVVEGWAADDPRAWNIGGAAAGGATAERGPSVIFIRNGKSVVLTDWSTWCDPTLQWSQCEKMIAAGVPLCDVTAEQLDAVMRLPAPRTPAVAPQAVPAIDYTKLAAALLDQLAARRTG